MPNTAHIEEIFGNPFDGISAEELSMHAGKLVAIAKDGSGILGSADTVEELYAVVSDQHPDQSGYLVQSVPDMSDMTAATYAEFSRLFN
jgi:hypothetical protein